MQHAGIPIMVNYVTNYAKGFVNYISNITAAISNISSISNISIRKKKRLTEKETTAILPFYNRFEGAIAEAKLAKGKSEKEQRKIFICSMGEAERYKSKWPYNLFLRKNGLYRTNRSGKPVSLNEIILKN